MPHLTDEHLAALSIQRRVQAGELDGARHAQPVAQWRDEADRLERRRRIAKRALRRQEQAQATEQQPAGLEWQLHKQREFMVEVVGNALGTCVEQLRDNPRKSRCSFDLLAQDFQPQVLEANVHGVALMQLEGQNALA